MNPYWDCNFFEFFAIFFSRIFSYPLAPDEVQLYTLATVAISCGLLGPFLVLKRMTMFANSISHTILIGIVLAFLITGVMFTPMTLLIGSFAAALLTAFFTEGMTRLFRVSEDASVGFVFSTLFALGIFLVTIFTRDVHLGLESITGNVDALQLSDLQLGIGLALLNISIIFLFFRQLQIAAFDRAYASTLGIRASLFHFLFLFLTAAVCVGSFRAVGVLLVLAFLTGPYLTARLFSNRLKTLLILSPALGILASFIGVAFSRHFLTIYSIPLSTGGLVVCTIGLFYLIGNIIKKTVVKNLTTETPRLRGNTEI